MAERLLEIVDVEHRRAPGRFAVDLSANVRPKKIRPYWPMRD